MSSFAPRRNRRAKGLLQVQNRAILETGFDCGFQPLTLFFERATILDLRWIVFVAAVSGLISVGIGAMGSHSLPKRLQAAGLSEADVQKKIGQCEIAVKYQMFHSLAALSLGLCPATASRRSWKTASFLFFVGISLFSGGLYSMVFFDAMGHWSIVPIGGATMMLGWLTLAIGSLFPANSAATPGILAS